MRARYMNFTWTIVSPFKGKTLVYPLAALLWSVCLSVRLSRICSLVTVGFRPSAVLWRELAETVVDSGDQTTLLDMAVSAPDDGWGPIYKLSSKCVTRCVNSGLPWPQPPIIAPFGDAWQLARSCR
jgi:hypothetical protein